VIQLHAFSEVPDDALRRLMDRAEPVVDRVLRGARRSGVQQADVEDIRSSVLARLVQRLRNSDAPIQNFEDFVASVTLHALDDFIRGRNPLRVLLKNRVRYVCTHDERFALWQTEETMVCGLAAWRGGSATPIPSVSRKDAPIALLDESRPDAALGALFALSAAPLRLDDVVRLLVELWQVSDRREVLTDPADLVEAMIDPQPSALERMERRQKLEILWREISELRLPQRMALLLHLRDETGMSAIPLLVITGVADPGAIASCLQWTDQELTEVWPELPFDDLRIAGLLDMSRQQVINLRKSARERLSRRIVRQNQ
jgi:DNA-directed RNA polymerase specialized sigma24 family protein